MALQLLTSGTTGPPKRQSIKTKVLERTVFSVTSGEAAPPGAPPSSPTGSSAVSASVS